MNIIRPNKGGRSLTLQQKKYVLQQISEFGVANGFMLLTEPNEYRNAAGILRWRAVDGVEFQIYESDLRKNGFPTNLTEYNRRSNMKNKTKADRWDDLTGWARERGGLVISDAQEYKDTATPLRFADAKGNEFTSNYQKMARGYWSPYERSGLGENFTRQVFKHIFGEDFQSRWDIVPSQKRGYLQLDGYACVRLFHCEKLIAFEYQGHQGHRIDDEVKARDRHKADFCRENGITLIQVSEIPKDKIWQSYSVYDIVTQEILNVIPILRDVVYERREEFELDSLAATRRQEKLKFAKRLGAEFGYTLISSFVTDDKMKLEWVNAITGEKAVRSLRQIKRSGWP